MKRQKQTDIDKQTQNDGRLENIPFMHAVSLSAKQQQQQQKQNGQIQ